MKKQLDTSTITNELKGQSLYFEDQSERLAQKETEVKQEPTKPTQSKETPKSKETANERTNERTQQLEKTEANDPLIKGKHESTKATTDANTSVPLEENDYRSTINTANKPTETNDSDRQPSIASTRRLQPVKRIIKRHSFQFYVDQIEDLKRLQANFQFQGLDIQLSELVRDAVSEYLKRAVLWE